QAYRMRYRASFGGAESVRASSGDPQYPPPGATINYWLGPDVRGPVSLEIADSQGRVVRRFSSAAVGESMQPPEQPGMRRPELEQTGTPRLPAVSGLNRFVWDLAHPGPWDSNPRRSGRNGPMATPGTYTVRVSADGVTGSEPLLVRMDPRAVADGAGAAEVRQLLAHNISVRDLVTDVNRAVARVQTARRAVPSANGIAPERLTAIEKRLVTPAVRYSQPGLQAQIQYLYGAVMDADQVVGGDAVARYDVLRKELDSLLAELRNLQGSQ
ncbi:MAG: hypothetical protein M3Q09_11820, partial [Gemmatimonadota bacterium]|nr:hypothetical protein [Gemmatimonadota bacterium]